MSLKYVLWYALDSCKGYDVVPYSAFIRAYNIDQQLFYSLHLPFQKKEKKRKKKRERKYQSISAAVYIQEVNISHSLLQFDAIIN